MYNASFPCWIGTVLSCCTALFVRSGGFNPALFWCGSEPVHSKKRKGGQSAESYEKLPRKMRKEEQKELIHLLPIKDKSRLIPQSMEKPGERSATPGQVLVRVLGWWLICNWSVIRLSYVFDPIERKENSWIACYMNRQFADFILNGCVWCCLSDWCGKCWLGVAFIPLVGFF